MALDHYISQVHLKNFYSPKLGQLMYAIRKFDLKFFTPKAHSVCRIEEGNTNLYLDESRAVEEFLKAIEPKYNCSIEKLNAGTIDAECIYTIAGFLSYLLTCTPAGMRIHSAPLKSVVIETARVMDAKGEFPAPPPELAGENLTDLLETEKVKVEIDQKYPQAIGIASILSHTNLFGNSSWEILLNPFDDSAFFTSDFPVAIEKSEDARVLDRIVPLTPNLAIRIQPNILHNRAEATFSFSAFRYTVRKLKRSEVLHINQLIVRCAESIVFFAHDYDWVRAFVKRNAAFRIEPITRRIPQGNGTLLWTTQEIVRVGHKAG